MLIRNLFRILYIVLYTGPLLAIIHLLCYTFSYAIGRMYFTYNYTYRHVPTLACKVGLYTGQYHWPETLNNKAVDLHFNGCLNIVSCLPAKLVSSKTVPGHNITFWSTYDIKSQIQINVLIKYLCDFAHSLFLMNNGQQAHF